MATFPAPQPADFVHRAFDPTPNGNAIGDNPPGTVGAGIDELGGDPHGVEVLGEPMAAAAFPTIPTMPWAGWPTEWATPAWGGQVQQLTDVAWSCIDLNSSLLSAMPVYTMTGGGVIRDNPSWIGDSPDPDRYTSWHEFARSLFWDYHLGEAFVLCTARYSNGWPARFHVAEPWTVEVELVGDGRRRYKVGGRSVPDGDMLHVRYHGTNSDARGHGPLEAGRARLVAAAMFGQYATNLARTGGVPASALITEQRLTSDQADELLHQWYQARVQHLGLPAVLSGGVKLETFQINPRDMSLVELSQLTDSRIAVMLGVPPFLQGLPSGGDSMTYQNVSTLLDYHWRAGLRPKVSPVMAALSGWALPRGTWLELNRDEYVRPGLAERASAWATLHGIRDDDGQRAVTVPEIRNAERFDSTTPAPATNTLLIGGMP